MKHMSVRGLDRATRCVVKPESEPALMFLPDMGDLT
jgi:hypothetical protein